MAKYKYIVLQSVICKVASNGLDAVIAPKPPTAKKIETSKLNLSFGNQIDIALNAPIKAPETPNPINPLPIVKWSMVSPKENITAPIDAIINKTVCTFLAPNLSSKIPKGSWNIANVKKYTDVIRPNSSALTPKS